MKPRALAISILARVRATDAFLNVVLDERLAEDPPSDPRDAALVTELVYGSTRRELFLDSLIARFADRKLDSIEDRVIAALRTGAYQVLFMRVPKHAAVSETVEALKELKLARAAGFANALLRKIAALENPLEGAPAWLRESHPEWLAKRWARHFGADRAESMMAADNLPAPLVIRANASKISRDALLAQLTEAGVEARATSVSPAGISLSAPGRVEDLLGYDEGLWQVQDEAAQLVGLFADVPDGARVLDACAAPGGKACHLAERLEVVAIDKHKNKLRKIESEAKRLGLSKRIEAHAHDATKALPNKLGEFHAVLVDAPCTGLGTLRRHPELRYRRKEEDIARLATLQREILEQCQQAVPAGGLLVYAVCSTEPQEGADQIEMFLRSHPEFTAEPPASPVKFPTSQGHLRTLPGPEAYDGFFAARLRRTM